jgi:hypothetical protein
MGARLPDLAWIQGPFVHNIDTRNGTNMYIYVAFKRRQSVISTFAAPIRYSTASLHHLDMAIEVYEVCVLVNFAHQSLQTYYAEAPIMSAR